MSQASGRQGFTYDADGNRVKRTDASGTTIYIGNSYEKNVTTSEVTSYYMFNGARVALRKYTGSPTNTSVTWLHSDVLGSASIATDATGGVVANSEQRYTPFGSPRLNAGGLPTDKTFTGQRVEAGLGGIMDYGARYYDPVIGRFLSADTVVPGAGGTSPAGDNPQALNRYSYGFNSPLNYTDPTGHDPKNDKGNNMNGDCDYAGICGNPNANILTSLAAIRFQDIFNTEGLQGNWMALLDAWFNNNHSDELGWWSAGEDGMDTVYINDAKLGADIQSRLGFWQAVANLKSKTEGWGGPGSLPAVGDTAEASFHFDLVASQRRGLYNAVEWFLGSYTVKLTVRAVDADSRTVSFLAQVSNVSGWESATRIPARYTKWLGPSLLPNRPLDKMVSPFQALIFTHI